MRKSKKTRYIVVDYVKWMQSSHRHQNPPKNPRAFTPTFKKHQQEERTMVLNLFKAITTELSGENTGKLAAFLGESNTSLAEGIGPAVASIIAGLMNRASTQEEALDLFNRITTGGYTERFTNRFGELLADEKKAADLLDSGKSILAFLFGTKQASLEKLIAATSGRTTGAASSLLAALAPFVMGTIGKQMVSENMESHDLMNLLASQKTFVQKAAPAALPDVLGLLSLSQLGGTPAPMTTGMPGNILLFLKKLWPFLLGIAVLAVLMKTCSHKPVQESPRPAVTTAPQPSPAVADTAVAQPDTAAVADSLGAFGEYVLPNGVRLNIPESGVERKLIAFIEDKTQGVDRESWFSFDRLVFDTGKATLKSESQEQLRNIHEILQAFPAVELKIGGYTDNVGDKQMNKRLSQARAEAVAAELERLGTQKARLSAEGYGVEHPVADNATEEGRQKNRRVDCRVTKK